MDANAKPFWNTTLAAVTAMGTLIGAVGGLIATVYAMGASGSDGAAPNPTPDAPPAATAPPPSAPAATVSVTPSPTAMVISLTPGADSWWGPPGWPADDEEDQAPGESEHLVLGWGCDEDSRGNGSKRDCGSGLIAIYFDLSSLAESGPVDEAVLTLQAEESAGDRVYVRRAASGWSEEDEARPECDGSGEVAGTAEDGEWWWDVTSIVQEQGNGDGPEYGFCLVLKEEGGVTFGSREGLSSYAPMLTITYR